MRLKTTLVAMLAASLMLTVNPASAAPFSTGGISVTSDVIAVERRRRDGAAAAAVGVGALAHGLMAGAAAAQQQPRVVYTPEPRVIYRQPPPDCHIERSRVWDPYMGAYVVEDRRVCY